MWFQDGVDALPISSDIFFDVFPFHIVFDRSMVIKNIGSGLAAVMAHIVGQAIDEMFMLTRPMVEFTMENVSIGLLYTYSIAGTWPIAGPWLRYGFLM